MKKVNNYKCSHSGKLIMLDSNLLSICAWMEWKDSAGFDGDNSLCWDCWNDEMDKEMVVRRLTK